MQRHVPAVTFVLAGAVAVYGSSPLGETIGNGLAGVPICGASKPHSVAVNYTLPVGETHGVLHHFWCTGARTKIDRMWVDYYIDGEASPSISFQPSMMCGLAFPTERTDEYSAGGLCGKSAPVGGWWNTFPIPFYKSAVVKVRADPVDGDGCFGGYVNIRGTVGMPLVLPQSGVALPQGTKMVLQKNPLAVRQPLEYVDLAELPAGQKGMVFQTSWAVQTDPVGGSAAGGGYIEGCWQFYRRATEAFPGLVVGTGVEDYFDSGYYFGSDSGHPVGTLFNTALSGLTLFQRTGVTERLSAYRFHTADPLVMTDGGRLSWRVGAKGEPGTTKCGNPLPPSFDDAGMAIDFNGDVNVGAALGRQLTAVNVTTYAWVYTFPEEVTTIVS